MKPHPSPSQDHADLLVERIRQALERLIPPDTQVPDRIIEEKAQGLLYAIVARAADFFAYCPDDFCIQTINESDGIIVFGGTNRLIWNAKYGYFPDQNYCSEKFLEQFTGEAWEKIGVVEYQNHLVHIEGSYHQGTRVVVPMDPRFTEQKIAVYGRKSNRGDGKLAEVRFNTGVEA
jgi:hypothetical protein